MWLPFLFEFNNELSQGLAMTARYLSTKHT